MVKQTNKAYLNLNMKNTEQEGDNAAASNAKIHLPRKSTCNIFLFEIFLNRPKNNKKYQTHSLIVWSSRQHCVTRSFGYV